MNSCSAGVQAEPKLTPGQTKCESLFYVTDVVLGLRQPFPIRCTDCREFFWRGEEVERIVMLREGEPRWEGRVLWAIWRCGPCARAGRPVQEPVRIEPVADEEPVEVRHARRSAERSLDRQATAVHRARRYLDEVARR